MIRGVDISFDGDARAIKAAGFDFALAEILIGTSVNPSGARNLLAFRANGLISGAYVYALYAHFDDQGVAHVTDPIAHAKAFCDYAQTLHDLETVPWLDVEQPDRKGSTKPLPLPAPVIVDWCEQYTDYVERELGVLMPFYTFPAYGTALGDALRASTKLGRLPFAPASYLKALYPQPGQLPMQCDPRSPYYLATPWGSRWSLWQTAGNVRVPGVPHIVDVDVFNGTAEELRALGKLDPMPLPDSSPTAIIHPDVPMDPPSDVGPITNE